MNSKAIVSGAIILFSGNLLSAFLGLFREVLIAAQYGADLDTDAYLFAYTVPSIILAFVSSIFLTGFVPLFIKERVNKSPEEASLMFSNTINWFLVIMLVVIGVCYGLSDWLSAFFADNPASHQKIEQLLWILLPGMLFFGLSYAQSTVLNSVNHFTTPAFMTVINNIVVILFMILFHQSLGIYSVALGFVIGNVVQVAVQIPVLRAKGIRYKRYMGVKDEYLRKLFALSMPIMTMVLIDQSMVFASRYFAAYLDVGSASAINYANRIIMLPVTLFGTALVSATYPSAVQMLAEKKQREYDTIVSTGIKSLLLMMTPVFFICMLFSTSIIRALFERGAFDADATRMTASAFLVLSAAIVIMPLRDFFNKLFFSRGYLKSSIIYSLGYTGGFIAFSLLLVPRIGYLGLAVATVASLSAAFFYLVSAYKRKYRDHALGVSASFIFKIAFSAALSSSIAYGAFRISMQSLVLNKFGEIVLMAVFCGTALLLYFLIVKWWKVEEVNFVWAKLSTKLPIGRRAGSRAAEGKA
ncbi:hypothetical protein GE107_20035 [Cohnella sp. CFH 77786]|uniref:murein biosynthesis integral membrane protein MurJ n=1 Tax=Cohnella sp. CFH 77786 TaxID=2662265 RepID=UPI001C60C15D|nr:murein biosynthesis integral membrane protein MurJ [Cohnella sp. CFH 77786]MBW5448336.1 hypothetical protein [Cohnella sp. CFH 77786]